MRQLRWKSKYLRGIESLDRRTKSLVDSLNGFAGEARQREHCQDLNEFFEKIATTIEKFLRQASDTNSATAEIEWLENHLHGLLVSDLPLGARGTPACTDCCLCSALEKTIRNWLGNEFENRADCLTTDSEVMP
jgi:hypothetical protein